MLAILALIISNLIWGAAPPVFKYALDGIPPFTLAFVRFFSAGLIFLPFAWQRRQSLSGFQLRHISLAAFWGISVNVAFFFIGLKMSPSINVHIISALAPLILYFLSLRILKEKPHPQIMKGMLVALLGVCIIVFAPLMRSGAFHSLAAEFSGLSIVLGNVFFIIAMFGSVLMTINNKQVLGKVDTIYVTCLEFFIGSIVFIPMMVRELSTWSFTMLTFHGWVGIIFGIFFSSALAYFLLNFALSKMHAQETGIYSYMLPVVAVLVAIPLLGEYPDWFFYVGALFVFSGLIMGQMHPHFHKVQKKARQR